VAGIGNPDRLFALLEARGRSPRCAIDFLIIRCSSLKT
jgi:tetraacyldisaccharide-1-P 4'-kinase